MQINYYRQNKICIVVYQKMPVINFRYDDFLSLVGKDIEKDEFENKAPLLGISIERFEDNEISIEVFPNRPDLLSVEGMARATRAFFNIEPGLKTYEIKPPIITLTVDKSVQQVRPYIVSAAVHNIEMSEELIVSLMELQEKLHFSVGKDRRKMAIGVHDLDQVKPPFVYKAVPPDSTSFVPLISNKMMTLAEILREHEKGVAYAELVTKFDRYPIILDKNGAVLSFPPIINGQLTALTYATSNIFIDVTGTDKNAVTTALNIITAALAERGGIIEQVKIVDLKEEYNTPDFSPRECTVERSYIEKLLELNDEKTINDALLKMGHNIDITDKTIRVYSPAWRADIIHPVDIIEDIAIGYGYDIFDMVLPKSVTFGSSLSFDTIHHIMIGLGFNDIITLSLSNPEKEFAKMQYKKTAVELENPISSEQSLIKHSLIPSLLEILNKNKHNDLPQCIYELGDVVNSKKNTFTQTTNLAGLKIDNKASFTECKSIVEALLKNLGFDLVTKAYSHPSFIDGRCAAIIVHNEQVGYFGELHPKTITNFELEYPVIAFEFDAIFLTPSLDKKHDK